MGTLVTGAFLLGKCWFTTFIFQAIKTSTNQSRVTRVPFPTIGLQFSPIYLLYQPIVEYEVESRRFPFFYSNRIHKFAQELLQDQPLRMKQKSLPTSWRKV